MVPTDAAYAYVPDVEGRQQRSLPLSLGDCSVASLAR